MINGIFLLSGSNIGDRRWYLDRSRELLESKNVYAESASSLYLTPPWGRSDQPYFLNQAIRVQTTLSPAALLNVCLAVEHKLGRVRKEKYGARTIDIDILYYNQLIINDEALSLPHPRLHLRRFALVPMTEISPDFIHPVFQRSQSALLEACTDTLPVRKICFR